MSAKPKRLPRVPCKLCAARVSDTFEAKWRHMLQRHPGALLERIGPMIVNPSSAVEFGRKLALHLRRVLG